jgi:hypothetical protein
MCRTSVRPGKTVDDPRRISVHLAPIPQPPTRDDIVASQKSRFENQDKTIDYIVLLKNR